MGENYLYEQVENAKRRRDRARGDLERPKLFDRPEVVEILYNVIPISGEGLEEGETLRGFATPEKPEIDVLRDHVQVARIEGDGARKLHVELSRPENGGVVSIRITSVSPLSGCADGRLIVG